jgi:hypothetical protein
LVRRLFEITKISKVAPCVPGCDSHAQERGGGGVGISRCMAGMPPVVVSSVVRTLEIRCVHARAQRVTAGDGLKHRTHVKIARSLHIAEERFWLHANVGYGF